MTNLSDDSDDSFEARMARQTAERLARWEERRRGRPTRLWEADIEVRGAATDERDAYSRLCNYMRHPYYPNHRGALLAYTRDLHQHPLPAGQSRYELEWLSAEVVGADERARLELDYPRVLPRPTAWQPYGPDFLAEVAEYVAALRLAARRVAGETIDDAALVAARPPLPDGTRLEVWRAVYSAQFLAVDDAAARARAEMLAATIVDWTGRPLGRVLAVAPDDGFRNPTTGRWLHPAELAGEVTVEELWDDYDAVEGTVGDPAALAALLAEAADELHGSVMDAAGSHRAYEARLHTQPDGTRTLSTPVELAVVALEAQAHAAGKTPAELRRLAEEADYLADRVYGKSVEGDDDVKRIERCHHQAKVYRQLAGDQATAATGTTDA